MVGDEEKVLQKNFKHFLILTHTKTFSLIVSHCNHILLSQLKNVFWIEEQYLTEQQKYEGKIIKLEYTNKS